MVYIALHDDKTRPLSFYLAMEEYIARSKSLSEDAFFLWQVEPSTMAGVERGLSRGKRGEHGLLPATWHPHVPSEEWGRMRLCRPKQRDVVIHHKGRKR